MFFSSVLRTAPVPLATWLHCLGAYRGSAEYRRDLLAYSFNDFGNLPECLHAAYPEVEFPMLCRGRYENAPCRSQARAGLWQVLSPQSGERRCCRALVCVAVGFWKSLAWLDKKLLEDDILDIDLAVCGRHHACGLA